MTAPRTGLIKWADLTVPNIEEVVDFYQGVVGWNAAAYEMPDRTDYVMSHSETGDTAAGICQQAGDIEGMPAQWMVYVTVEDLDDSIEAANRLGGKVVFGPRESEMMGRWCVVQDPAGAVMALTELTPGEDN
ncbi:MAG: VOC family protein [Solirubrobacterales bacterium]